MKDWIKELKPGDKVALRELHNFGGLTVYKIGTVKRITAGGKVRLENGMLCDNIGYVNHESFATPTYSIVPLTDEIREVIYRKRIVSKVKSIEFSVLKLGQLERILKIIEE